MLVSRRFDRARLSLRRCAIGRLAFLLAAFFVAAGQSFGATPELSKSEVDRLVSEAAQAEIRGDSSKSAALLKDAIRIDPENERAHWQLGQVKVDKQWVTVEDAQRRASTDPLQAEYRERRAASSNNPQLQLPLARWCRKKGLTEEALFHWASVLAADPKNEEALRSLGLHWQNGMLMTSEQADEYKDQVRERKRANERWASKIVKWRRDVSGRGTAARDAALAEIGAITQIDSIYPLEQITLGRDAQDPRHADECLAIGLAFIKALSKIPGQPATESLVRHAVFAQDNGERAAAIDQLKRRDKHDYVPMLLDGLAMPIESTFVLQTDSIGSVHYAHSLYREGAEADWSTDSNYHSMQQLFSGRNIVYRQRFKVWEDRGPTFAQKVTAMVRDSNISQARYGNAAATVEQRVANANQATESLNARIMPVLSATTGKEFDSPRQWWDYWRDNNEYYAEDRRVNHRYFSGTNERSYGTPYDTYSSTPSCFVKGTPVWTKTGRRPIESLELGDLVLAQDVESGALKYMPIIGRTVRPPSPIVKLTVDKEEVRTTRGHLFWVAGVGWRMSKELEKGVKLHGLKGSSEVREVASDGEAEAYNLVIADMGTYFVGDQGLLVHDNTPRSPTQVILPGVLAKK